MQEMAKMMEQEGRVSQFLYRSELPPAHEHMLPEPRFFEPGMGPEGPSLA